MNSDGFRRPSRSWISRICRCSTCAECPGVLLEDDLSDQPAELVQWLRDARPSLQLDADGLAEIPLSLDHPDVNSSNAIMLDDGRAILLDWEEATVGCPLFGLDRLLDEAHEISAVEA